MKFEIGEIAIYVRPGSPHYGEEVTILSNLRPRYSGPDFVSGVYIESTDYLVYEISESVPPDGPLITRVAKPEWLRKKPQRRECDRLVKWSDCEWSPNIKKRGNEPVFYDHKRTAEIKQRIMRRLAGIR